MYPHDRSAGRRAGPMRVAPCCLRPIPHRAVGPGWGVTSFVAFHRCLCAYRRISAGLGLQSPWRSGGRDGQGLADKTTIVIQEAEKQSPTRSEARIPRSWPICSRGSGAAERAAGRVATATRRAKGAHAGRAGTASPLREGTHQRARIRGCSKRAELNPGRRLGLARSFSNVCENLSTPTHCLALLAWRRASWHVRRHAGDDGQSKMYACICAPRSAASASRARDRRACLRQITPSVATHR
jgi:hypothetical protein